MNWYFIPIGILIAAAAGFMELWTWFHNKFDDPGMQEEIYQMIRRRGRMQMDHILEELGLDKDKNEDFDKCLIVLNCVFNLTVEGLIKAEKDTPTKGSDDPWWYSPGKGGRRERLHNAQWSLAGA